MKKKNKKESVIGRWRTETVFPCPVLTKHYQTSLCVWFAFIRTTTYGLSSRHSREGVEHAGNWSVRVNDSWSLWHCSQLFSRHRFPGLQLPWLVALCFPVIEVAFYLWNDFCKIKERPPLFPCRFSSYQISQARSHGRDLHNHICVNLKKQCIRS